MTKLRTAGLCSLAKMACIVIVFCAATISASRAQTFSTLVTFDGTDGDHPTTGQGPLVQGFDGNLYGSTFSGGTSGYYGLVFKMTPTGGLNTVYNFCSQTNCADGAEPGPPILATDGSFYGTTYGGGNNTYSNACSSFPCGTVYKISSLGTHSTLYSFCAQPNCADGGNPPAMLTQGTDGNFYGTTQDGGATGYGTFFRITPKGVLTTLHNFCAQPSCADGYSPSRAYQLVLSKVIKQTHKRTPETFKRENQCRKLRERFGMLSPRKTVCLFISKFVASLST